jgi:hypothetical protein
MKAATGRARTLFDRKCAGLLLHFASPRRYPDILGGQEAAAGRRWQMTKRVDQALRSDWISAQPEAVQGVPRDDQARAALQESGVSLGVRPRNGDITKIRAGPTGQTRRKAQGCRERDGRLKESHHRTCGL